ncbi:MAG: hypothetical protein ACRCVX_14900 [Shewanella sp.]
MAVRLAAHLDLAKCEDFYCLPTLVQKTFNAMKYIELVSPLMEKDREQLGLSYRQLEIKYGIPKSTIQVHLNDKKYF